MYYWVKFYHLQTLLLFFFLIIIVVYTMKTDPSLLKGSRTPEKAHKWRNYFAWPLVNPPTSSKFVAVPGAWGPGITSWRVQQGVDGERGWTWQQSWKKDQALGEGGSWPQEGSNTVSLLQGGLNSKTWIPSHHFSAVSHRAYTNSSSINLGIIFSLWQCLHLKTVPLKFELFL